MKNKSFKNYYDEIQVDENLLQQIPIKKHHYYKPILIISCVVLLFVLGIQNKETKDTFEILAYNQTYNSITIQATPMDYYLIHDQVNIMDKVQLKKKYEEKYFSKKTDFKQSQLDLLISFSGSPLSIDAKFSISNDSSNSPLIFV